MEDLKEFVIEKINSLPKKRRFIGGDEEFERDFNVEAIVARLEEVGVYRMTQDEIDDNIESYPDYYEQVNNGDIVFYDGEVPFPIDALDTWIDEVKSSWRKGEIDETDSDVRDYITYLYAQELVTKLEQETKPEKQIYKVQVTSTITIEVDGDIETVTGCNIGLALDNRLDKSKYLDDDGNFNEVSLENIKMAFSAGLGSCLNIGDQIGIWDSKEQIPRINDAIKVLTKEPIDYRES